jgi:hypothetical protein
MAWDVEGIKEHFNQRFADQDKAVQAALVAQEKAVSAALAATKEAVIKAETAADKRFESVNEFRAQLTDQTRTFMPRAEMESRSASLGEKLDALDKRLTTTEGRKQGSGDTWKVIAAVIAVSIPIIGILISIVLTKS